MIPWYIAVAAFIGGLMAGVVLTALISAGGDDRE